MSVTTILMLAGGRSSEHDVSLVSARGAAAALDPEAFTVIPVLIAGDGTWTRDGAEVMLATSGGRPVLVSLHDGADTAPPVPMSSPVYQQAWRGRSVQGSAKWWVCRMWAPE